MELINLVKLLLFQMRLYHSVMVNCCGMELGKVIYRSWQVWEQGRRNLNLLQRGRGLEKV
jgi:hypothetical protein